VTSSRRKRRGFPYRRWDICWFTIQPVLSGEPSRSRGRTGVPMAVPHSRYSYPLREDSELSSGACSPPRYNPHWLPIHTTNTRTIHVRHGLTSCRRHTVNTSSRCPIRSLSVLRLHVLRPCIRGTGRCDRTPTCGVSCCRPSPVGVSNVFRPAHCQRSNTTFDTLCDDGV